MRKLILIMLMLGLAHDVVFAQEVLNAVDKKQNFQQRKAVAYTPIREADAVYARKISRIIDTREKNNLVMKWPKNPFSQVIFKYLKQGEDNSSGKLRAYYSDSFVKPLTIAQVKKVGQSCNTFNEVTDPDHPYDSIKERTVCTDLDFSEITRFEINEVWIFDKQRGAFFPRIVSIAPLYIPRANDIALNEQPMFYIKYEDLRQLMVSEPMFNRQNDATPLSYYDFFEQRMFSSYITKESNPQDLAIRDMPDFKDKPMDAMYESERVKKSLVDWENDLWEQ